MVKVEGEQQKILTILDYSQSVLGEIRQTEDGLIGLSQDPNLQLEFTSLVSSLQGKSLPLRGGFTIDNGHTKSRISTVKDVPWDDEKYLDALKDNLHNYEVGGKKIIGIISQASQDQQNP